MYASMSLSRIIAEAADSNSFEGTYQMMLQLVQVCLFTCRCAKYLCRCSDVPCASATPAARTSRCNSCRCSACRRRDVRVKNAQVGRAALAISAPLAQASSLLLGLMIVWL